MGKVLVEGFDAHGAHIAVDHFANRVVNHGRDNTGVETKTVGEVGRAVVFAAADVDFALTGLAERQDASIQAVNEGTQRNKVERALFGCRNEVEFIAHAWLPSVCYEFNISTVCHLSRYNVNKVIV